jgi:Autotransporter beta-domain
MKNTSLERAPFAARIALRRAALLAGAGLFFQAAPAWAVNECGPPPVSDGTITCPAGEYPNGINYFVPFGATEFRIEPGFIARDGSFLLGRDVRVIGPVNTSFSTSPIPGPSSFSVGLALFVLGPVFVDIDDAHGTKPGDSGLSVLGSRSVTVRADAVTSVGVRGVGVTEIFHVFASVDVPLTGVNLRVNSVSTTGNNATGITASSEQGNVSVVVGTLTTAGNGSKGIIVDSHAVSTITSGTIKTSGDDSTAIHATGGTQVTLVSDRISTSGAFSYGIIASTDGGPIGITSGTINTVHQLSEAIHATVGGGGGGAVTIKSDGIAGAGSGIYALTGGAVDIASNSIATTGNGSTGIDANGATVAINSGTIRTTGATAEGIQASAQGAIGIASGSVDTAGQGSEGIRASSTNGPVNITSGQVITRGQSGLLQPYGIIARSSAGDVSITSGTVRTAADGADGISAFSGKDTRIVSDTISTTGRFAEGISASTNSGSLTINSGTVITFGNGSVGLSSNAFGSGPTSITTGSITTQGSEAAGVRSFSRAGAIDITATGTIATSGATSPGILAVSDGAVTVTANNVSVSGADSDAITVKGSTSTVTIRGLVQSSQGLAVRSQDGLPFIQGAGGPTTLNILAGGTLRGRVSLTPGADRIANSGTFDAMGMSQLGAGADVFDNNAGGTARSVNGAATFAGLESFNNRGTIEMRDGATNDSLSLSGAYFGAGAARLGLDVDFAAGTADRLVTGAATGSTTIDLQGTGTGGFTSGILLVDAGTGTSPTAFTLAGGSETPYLRNSLRFDAANNDFLLVRLPGQAVFETARFGAMASQLWYESADAIAAQLDTVRDGRRGRGVALWLQGWTGERERDGTQSLAGAGTFDVSFEQDFQGLQGGLDFQSGSGVIGITGGAGRSDAAFVSGNPVDMEVKNLGLYAQVRAGPLFFNALAKRDWAELDINPGAGLGAEFDADLFGVQANAGLRLGSGAFFAEPSVGLSWVQADLDSFESGPATVEPGGVDSLRARAGLRVGARLPIGGGDLLPFAAVNVYEELDDGNETEFTLGETLRLFDEPAGTRGQAAAGISFVAAGFEAFVRGEMDFSGGDDAKAVRAGARLRF